MAHSNEDVLRREIEGIAAGASLEEFYADDVVVHFPGNSPFAGDYRGHEGLAELFRKFGEVASSVERELHDAMANEEHGVQLLTVRAERKDGRTHAWQAIWVSHFRNGKISELWGHITDQAALDEFLGIDPSEP
jgi:hypothetical protein